MHLEMILMREEVERMLTTHGVKKGISKMRTDEDELRRIAKYDLPTVLMIMICSSDVT